MTYYKNATKLFIRVGEGASQANEKCTEKPLVTIRHIRQQYYCQLGWLLVFMDV
jgi:hypothetical protein